MKKLLLCLCATMLFGITSFAQGTAYWKSSMVLLVNEAKNTFTTDIDFKDWLVQQTGAAEMKTAQEEKVLSEIYKFLSSKANSATIYKSYNGTSLLELKKLYDKGGMTTLNSTNQRCGFFCYLIIIIFFPDLPEILDSF